MPDRDLLKCRTSLHEKDEVAGLVMRDTAKLTCVNAEEELWTSRIVSFDPRNCGKTNLESVKCSRCAGLRKSRCGTNRTAYLIDPRRLWPVILPKDTYVVTAFYEA